MTGRFPALEPLEIATGMPVGRTRQSPVLLPSLPPGPDLRRALRAAVLPGLLRPPCIVSFSGGRDSSAVLAVAAEVARTEGLSLPLPVTLRFPHAPRAQEDEWQEKVVRHLGLDDWSRIYIDEELDVVGPIATQLLRRHGLGYPAQVQCLVPAVQAAGGGSVLTGLGGDELFIPWRSTRWAAVAGAARVRSRRALVAGLLAVAPPTVRRPVLRRRLSYGMPWLRGGALRAAARWQAGTKDAPADYLDALQRYLSGRGVELLMGCLRTVGHAYDVDVRHPLLEPGFVAAVGSGLSPAARGDRAVAMGDLVGDLLPAESLTRGTKAVFNEVLWGAPARAFVAGWDGTGLDEDLIDIPALRQTWNRPVPPTSSWLLLQQAWLSQEAGGPPPP